MNDKRDPREVWIEECLGPDDAIDDGDEAGRRQEAGDREGLKQYYKLCCAKCRKHEPKRLPDSAKARLCNHLTGFENQAFCGRCAIFKQDCHCCEKSLTRKMHCRSCGTQIGDTIDKERERERQRKKSAAAERRKKKKDGRIVKLKAAA